MNGIATNSSFLSLHPNTTFQKQDLKKKSQAKNGSSATASPLNATPCAKGNRVKFRKRTLFNKEEVVVKANRQLFPST